MSGFLEHLVQRSLTASAAVRPRPVSIFESIQPSPVTDPPQSTSFEMGRDFSAGDPMQFDWRPTSKLDPESQNTTPAMTSASPTHADESSAASEKAPRPEPRVGSLVEEEKLRPTVAEPGRRGTRTTETLQGREKPEAHRPSGETLVHSMTRPDTVDSTRAMRSRPLQVEGKLVAECTWRQPFPRRNHLLRWLSKFRSCTPIRRNGRQLNPNSAPLHRLRTSFVAPLVKRHHVPCRRS
jgi:hypothetical protein